MECLQFLQAHTQFLSLHFLLLLHIHKLLPFSEWGICLHYPDYLWELSVEFMAVGHKHTNKLSQEAVKEV